MINIIDKQKCTGCCACMNICPNNCIEMNFDKEGFVYPCVNSDICIDCKLCEKNCPILYPLVSKYNYQKAYAVVNGDEKIRLQSSSGGFFTVVALDVIKSGGVVVGAKFTPDFQVEHAVVTSELELDELRGSKYVQSTIGNIYSDIKKYLDNGVKVLFTGTACQIQGLKSFLGVSKYEQLLLCIDIICHGIPSPKVWQEYVKLRENRADSKARRISFRSKCIGWKEFSVCFEFENGVVYSATVNKDLFMRGFLKDIYLRPSCYSCKFKTQSRISDFTMADLWGADKIVPDMDDDKGLSLVIVQSEQGGLAFDRLKNKTCWREISLEDAIKCNKAMVYSFAMPNKRIVFFQELLHCSDVELLIHKCIKPHIIRKIYLEIRHLGGYCLRKLGLLK